MNAITAAPITIRADILAQIGGIAEQEHIQLDTFVNTILEQYLREHIAPKPSRDAAFLLSLGGMFNSGNTTASEQVHELVRDVIVKKYAR